MIYWIVFTLKIFALYWPFVTSDGGYKCVFGFSTGHVGTGTFTDRNSYNNVDHIEFLFEGYRLAKLSQYCRVSPQMYNRGFTAVDEEEFVKKQLARFFAQITHHSGKTIVVDFGHANLFYYRGIAMHFLSRSRRGGMFTFCRDLHFVRIRRERYDAATSLMYRTPHNAKSNLCGEVPYAFCPYNNTKSVILHPVSEDAWHRLSVFEQMLWFIDETEARWQGFRRTYEKTSIKLSEITWGTIGEGAVSLQDAIHFMAGTLNTTARDKLSKRNVHANLSATHATRSQDDWTRFFEAEKRYAAAMGRELSKDYLIAERSGST